MKGKLSVGKKVLIAIFAVLALFSLIAGICLPKLTNNAFADGTETVYPAYTALKITQNSYTFQTDDSSDSMKARNAFTVEGAVKDGPYEEITDKTLYEFVIDNPEKNGRFSTVNPNTVYARYLHAAEGTEVTSNSVTVWSITPVTPKSVRIEVADGWSLSEGYYRQTVTKGDKSYQISAFVDTMSQQSVFEHLKVVAVYERSELEVVFDYNNNVISGIKTGETFGSATSSFTTGNNSVEVTVDGITGKATLPFEAQRVVSIDLVGWKQPTGLTSASNTDVLNFGGRREDLTSNYYIVPTYNTGVSNAQDLVSTTVEGLLTPTGKDIAAALAQGSGDYLYNRTVSIKYTGGESEADRSIVAPIKVEVKDIKYVAPSEINNRFTGRPTSQTAHADFNYDGISLDFYYGDDTASVPLDDLKDEESKVVSVEYTYQDGSKGTTLTRKVTTAAITVRFDYKTDEGTEKYQITRSFSGFRIDPVRLAMPRLDEGYDLITYVPPTEGESNTYKTLVFDEAIEEPVDVQTPEGASYDAATGKISFSKAGRFDVVVYLQNESEGDYEWNYSSSVGGGTIALDQENVYKLIYTIQVDRADIVLDLAYTSIDRTYGWKEETDSEIGATVTATLKDDPNTAIKTIGTNPVYKFWYYTSSTGISNATETKPKDVGNYFVFVRTVDESSELYKPAETAPQPFTIEPKELTTDITKDVPYDGNAHQISEFIDETKNVFAYDDDTFDMVFVSKDTPTDTGKDGEQGYVHVNPATDYSATLKLNSSNYKWAGQAATVKDATVHFNLTKKRLDIKTTATGFTYGDADANPNASVSDEAKGFITFSDKKFYYQGTTLKEDTTSFSEWDAGDYTACFPWNFAGKYVNANDIELYVGGNKADLTDQAKSVSTDFKIHAATLIKIGFLQDTALGEYKNEAYSISIAYWADMLKNLKNSDKITDILKIEATGKLTDGTTDAERITIDYEKGIISVIDAGTYQITISFLDTNVNYQWIAGEAMRDPVSTNPEDPYTVSQKELTFQATNGKDLFTPDGIVYTFDDEAHLPSVVPSTGFAALDWTLADGAFSGGKLSVTFSVKDSHGNPATQPKAADTYTVTVTGFSGEKIDGASYNYDVNFKLPQNCEFTFIINSSALKIPTLDLNATGVLDNNSVSVVYNGAAYTFSEYLAQAKDNNFEAYLKSIVIVGADNLKDVKFDGSSVTGYTITVKPATNYKWETGTEDATYTFTFTITQKAIAADKIQWSEDQTYNGQSLTFTASILAGGLLENDSVELEVTFDGGAPINAGSYTGKAQIVQSGTKWQNYSVDATHAFKVNKYALQTPVATTDTTDLKYTGVTQSVHYGNISVPAGVSWHDLVTVSATHKIPVTFNTNATATEFITNQAFDGTFGFVNAGHYIVTLNLTEEAKVNYCFGSNESTASVPLAGFSVGRLPITLPAFGSHTYQWDGNPQKPTFDNNWVQSEINDVQLKVNFTVELGIWAGLESNTANEEFTSRGFYYARITMTSATANEAEAAVYNFVWTENTDDYKDMGSTTGLKYGADASSDEKNGGTVFDLMYKIINRELTGFTFKITDYTFGDNGAGGKLLDIWNENSLIKVVSDGSAGSNLTEIETIFTAQSPAISYEFTGANGVVTDLSNGLPWKAGRYSVTIKVDFTDSSDYEDLSFDFHKLEFANATQTQLIVSQKTIDVDSVTFSNTDAVTYNGEKHPVTVTFKQGFLPTKEGAADHVDVVIGMEEMIDAGTKNLKVIINSCADAANFTVKTEGEKAAVCNVTINPRPVTIYGYAANETFSETYGEAIPAFQWGYFGDSVNDVGKKFVNQADVDSLNLNVTLGGSVVDGYYVAGVHDINVTFTKNDNYTITVQPRTFEITKRNITVSVNAGAHGTYGDDVNLYDHITVTNKMENDDIKHIVKLTSDASKTADVGFYAVTGTPEGAKSGNYNLTFNVGDYEIVNADFTLDAVAERTAVYNAQAQHVIKAEPGVQGGVNLSSNNLTFKVALKLAGDTQAPAVDDARWHAYDTETVMNVNTDAADYWLLATADNHKSQTASFTFKITPAEITVTWNHEIWFGEANPADKNFKKGIAEDLAFTLLGSDAKSVVTGSFTYTVENYQAGSAADTYTVNLDVSGLKSGNYTFTAGASALTVKPLEMVVTINAATSKYGDPTAELTYTYTTPKSSYDADAYVALVEDEAAIFTLQTTANADVFSPVGTYSITGKVNDGKNVNYDITFTSGEYTVTNAVLTVNVEGKNTLYTEKLQALLNAYTATGVDDAEGSFLYYAVKKGEGAPTAVESEEEWNDLLNGNTASAEVPASVDAWDGYVYYCVTLANHATVYGYVSAEISQATNELDKDFAYDGSAMKWVYGYGGDGGFSQKKVTNPEVKFTKAFGSDAKTPIKVAVNRVDDAGQVIALIVAATYEDGLIPVKDLLDDVFAGNRAQTFTAGKYVLTVTMDETDNYTALNRSFNFTVEQRDLTVKAQDQNIFYGDDAATFVAVPTGLVSNIRNVVELEKLEDVLGQVGFITNYAAGSRAGTYTITVDNKTYTAANYKVTFEKATLTVDKRPVTVVIADKENHYNLQKNSEEAQKLTFTLKGEGTFYTGDLNGESASVYDNDNQKVITLKTEALTNSNSAIKTNNVKLESGNNVGYPIYAVWRNHAEAYSYAENYEITIEVEKAESRKTVTTDGAIANTDGSANAATFMILPALMSLKSDKTPVGTYNALPQNYTMKVDGDETVEIVSKYVGRGGTEYELTEVAPTNVGLYTVTFSSSDSNYQTPPDFALDFEIKPATVTITPIRLGSDNDTEKAAWVKYGTEIGNNGAAIDNYFSGFDLLYTFALGAGAELKTAEEIIANERAKGYWSAENVTYNISNYGPTKAAEQKVNVFYDSGITSPNFTQEKPYGELKVEKRPLTLTVKGFDADRNPLAGLANDLVKVTYKAGSYQSYLTEELAKAPDKFFKPSDGWNGSSGDTLKTLGLTLTNGGATNYGVYKMTAGAASASNYEITYVQDAYFVIEKAPLKVYAQVTDKDGRGEFYVGGNFHDATSDYPNGYYTAEHYSAVYGNSVGFAIGFDGFLNNQTFEGLKQANGMVLGTGYRYTTAYNQENVWLNNVGRYSVLYGGAASDNAGELEFLNYEITYVPTLFTVTQRTVSASVVKDNVYTEAKSGYHNGEWGATLDAEIRFANAGNGLSALNPNYLPAVGTAAYQYTRTYSGTGAAPNKVGKYNVTLTFHTTSNYQFADGATTVTLTDAYQITPKPIALAWGPSASIPDFGNITDENEKVRTISEYAGEIMEFASEGFSRVTDNGGSSSTETVPTTAYTLKNDGLAFTAYGAGTYILVIQLKSSARNNYTLNGAAENGKVTLTLVVSSNSVELIITGMKGWTYRETANTPTVTVDGTPATNVPFTYARLGSNADYTAIAAEYKDKSLNTLEGLSVNDSHFNANVPVNAGGYIVRAYWQATGQYAYRLFEILPMTITSPALNVITSGVDRNDTFNGNTLVMEIARQEGVVVTANNGCNVMPSGSSVRLEAMNARTYNIVFSLESENYVWSGSETTESDGTVVKTWTVNKGQDTINDLTVTGTLVYGDTFDASATSTYGGRITYLYQEAKKGTEPKDVESGWNVKSLIQDAKTYWVRATTEDSSNYLGGVAYYTFTIAKATLTVTPYATITYGDTFRTEGGAGYRYEVSGFLRGDNNSVISGNVTYSVPADVNLHVTDEGVVLTVDVSGLSALNYTFEPAEGKLTVGKKSIVVSIGNAEAYYSVEISVADVKLTVADNALVSGDTVDKLNITLKVVDALGNSVSKGADVGSYSIVCDSSDAADYALNFNSGIFTVKALPVVVSLGANGGAYDGNAKEAEVISVVCNVTGYDQAIVASELTSKLAFNYTGVTMGGVAYNSDKAPADAGSYMASVTGVSANFTLLTTPSISFTISKKVINEGDIKIASQEYDGGKPLVPDISETADYDVAIGNYTVAGTHQVILTLKHANNTQWKGTTQDFCTVDFVVTPANNVATKPLAIEGWTFGSAANAPEFAAKYESAYTYRYYDADGNLLDGVPTNAGTYSVTVSAAGTSNWNALPESTRVTFTIAKQTLNAPKVVIVADGEEKNDTYTGGELRIRVTGYDHLLMGMNYAGNSVVNGNEVTLVAVNAGDYAVTFSLADSDNYAWASALGVEVDSAGGATLGWKINRKKVNKPKPGNNKLIVNGKVLTYLPEGFDPEIMEIEGNEAGYGGSFTASVKLIDPNNYEWAEGGNTVAEAYPFRIVGANTVFIAVICSLSGVAVIAAGAAITQAVMHKRKKRLAEESMDEIDRLSGDTPNGPSNGAADGTAGDAPAETAGEAQSANVGGNE